MSDEAASVSPGQRAFEAYLAEDGCHVPGGCVTWDELEPAGQALWQERAEEDARRERLTAEHGKPVHIDAADALALFATGGQHTRGVYRSVRRSPARTYTPASTGTRQQPTRGCSPTWSTTATPNWHASPLPDGRIVGILDLRPALEKARREAREGT